MADTLDYKAIAQCRKAYKIAKVLEVYRAEITPLAINASGDEWRRVVEQQAHVSKASDTTWNMVAILLCE